LKSETNFANSLNTTSPLHACDTVGRARGHRYTDGVFSVCTCRLERTGQELIILRENERTEYKGVETMAENG
jgi:hypothetical protein